MIIITLKLVEEYQKRGLKVNYSKTTIANEYRNVKFDFMKYKHNK